MVEPEQPTRSAYRLLVLAFFALLALSLLLVTIITWSSRDYAFGWNLAPNGTRITYVTPGQAAYRAGIRAGDRIDWTSLPIVGRANLGLIQTVMPDTKVRITVRRGPVERTITLAPRPVSDITEHARRVTDLARIVLIVTGILLVQMRPSRMTWGFLLSSLAIGLPSGVSHWGQSGAVPFLIANGLEAIFTGVAAAGILIFMSRFPADKARGPLHLLDRYAVPIGAAVAAVRSLIVIEILFSAAPPSRLAMFVSEYLIEVLLIIIALGALTTSYLLTKGSDRQRILPVLLAFAFYVATEMARYIYVALYTNAEALSIIYMLSAASILSLTFAVAHGVLRHRVFDVSFVISRTLVYTVLTSIIVGTFVAIDYVTSKLIEHLQIAAVLEAVAALGLGVWLNVLHNRIDHFVDRVLFRRRHLAEKRLDRTAKTLIHAETEEFVDEALVIEACDALALASAAVFRRNAVDEYVRVCARGWADSDLAGVPPEDYLVVNLTAELEPVDLPDVRWPHADIPSGTAQPLLAIPFVVRHELLGFALYGAHSGGEAIDPDERQTLMRLASAASAAYEYLHSKTLLSETMELRAQNEILRHEQSILREMVETMRVLTRPVQS